MNAQQALQKKLAECLLEAKLKNPAFSQRGLAKRLGISAASLSRLLSGHRKSSSQFAGKILERLGLDPVEIQNILNLFPQKRAYGIDQTQSPEVLQLTMDQYKVVADWQAFALRALLRTETVQKSPKNSSPQVLAKRLGISTALAKNTIKRLLRLKMIEYSDDGRLKATDEVFHSPDGIPSQSIRHNHAQHLELARESLDRDSVEIRDFTNLVVTVNSKNILKAKQLIRQFRKHMDQLLRDDSTGPRDEVYNLSILLFPLTIKRRK